MANPAFSLDVENDKQRIQIQVGVSNFCQAWIIGCWRSASTSGERRYGTSGRRLFLFWLCAMTSKDSFVTFFLNGFDFAISSAYALSWSL